MSVEKVNYIVWRSVEPIEEKKINRMKKTDKERIEMTL